MEQFSLLPLAAQLRMLQAFVKDLLRYLIIGHAVERIRRELGWSSAILFCRHALDLLRPFGLLLQFRQQLLLEVVFFRLVGLVAFV